MRAADRAKLDLLAAARRFLALTHGAARGPLTVVVTDGSAAVVTSGAPAPGRPAPLPESLTPLQRQLAEALTGEPQTAKALARRAGRTYSGHARTALADLVELRVARRDRRGYTRETP